jgi:hypothetical protein
MAAAATTAAAAPLPPPVPAASPTAGGPAKRVKVSGEFPYVADLQRLSELQLWSVVVSALQMASQKRAGGESDARAAAEVRNLRDTARTMLLQSEAVSVTPIDFGTLAMLQQQQLQLLAANNKVAAGGEGAAAAGLAGAALPLALLPDASLALQAAPLALQGGLAAGAGPDSAPAASRGEHVAAGAAARHAGPVGSGSSNDEGSSGGGTDSASGHSSGDGGAREREATAAAAAAAVAAAAREAATNRTTAAISAALKAAAAAHEGGTAAMDVDGGGAGASPPPSASKRRAHPSAPGGTHVLPLGGFGALTAAKRPQEQNAI